MSEVENVDHVVSESESESEGEEAHEIMNNEGPVETESTSEVTVEPVSEEEEAPAEEAPAEEAPAEEAPAEEAPAEEAPAEEAPAEEAPAEEAPAEEAPAEEAPAEEAPASTQEVVRNVLEILSSTETNVSGNDLEERVKVLEERLENISSIFSQARGVINISGPVNAAKYIIENLP